MLLFTWHTYAHTFMLNLSADVVLDVPFETEQS